MAEGKEPEDAPEPSMEEILASIRRIIADEDAPKPEAAAAGEDVVELTQLVEEDGSVVDLKPPEPAPAKPVVEDVVPPPLPEEAPMAPPLDIAPLPEEDNKLLSDGAANSANASLAALANVVNLEKMAASALPMTPVGNGMRTLENMVMELMRPMLKEWLDQNLPLLVERMVQKEIERISKHNED